MFAGSTLSRRIDRVADFGSSSLTGSSSSSSRRYSAGDSVGEPVFLLEPADCSVAILEIDFGDDGSSTFLLGGRSKPTPPSAVVVMRRVLVWLRLLIIVGDTSAASSDTTDADAESRSVWGLADGFIWADRGGAEP